MISLIEIWAKHGDENHAKLTKDDLQKNINPIKWNRKLNRGNKDSKTVYPSSKSKSDLKSAAYKVNDIKSIKLRKAKRI